MAFINLKYYSEVLGRQTEIDVMLPQKSASGAIGVENNGSAERYKTLLLLHGLSDDKSIWSRYTCIDRYAMEYGIAVVCPTAEKSFYTDMKYGDKYYTYISDEVLRIARQFLPLSDKREDTFIAGNSMGGYGALKIGLKNPDKFAAAAGLSSVADVQSFIDERRPDLKELIFGSNEKIADEENLFALADMYKDRAQNPRIYMGVGFQDYMYKENVRLKEHFEKLGYDFTYRESEGGHNWKLWDEYIQYVLKWIFE